MRLWILLAISGLISVGCAPVMIAPPFLVAAWPTANATLRVAKQTLDLTFNRLLDPEKTWATVCREEDGAPVATQTAVDSVNGRELLVNILDPSPGRYRLVWHAVSARTRASTDGEQAFSMQDQSIAAPRLQVSRLSADSGDRVELTGHGFGKKSPVLVSIGDDVQPFTSTETNNQGGFDTEARVPPSVPFGVQPLVAVDARGATATAALRVRWGGWPPVIGFTMGQSGPRSGEVTFWVSLRNRSDYMLERVQVRMKQPEGAMLVLADPAPTMQDQTLTWSIPIMDRGVVGPFRATFQVSGPVSTHTVIGFRHRRPRDCTAGECSPAFVSETTTDSTLQSPAD